MIRTTVRLPDDLLDVAKAHAQRTGRTLTQLLADAVRAEVERPAFPRRVSEPAALYGVRAKRARAEEEEEEAPAAQLHARSDDAAAARDALLEAQVADLQAFVRSLPVRDNRTLEEILSYDEFGLPT